MNALTNNFLRECHALVSIDRLQIETVCQVTAIHYFFSDNPHSKSITNDFFSKFTFLFFFIVKIQATFMQFSYPKRIEEY